MHFYESSIITTKDGIHFQVYGNEHPVNSILAKPKYIPCENFESSELPCRFISGRKMNRLNLWASGAELKKYIENFKKYYPHYIFKSNFHTGNRLFFSIPIDQIERIYSPKKGLGELMSIPPKYLDPHLESIQEFINFLLKSGLKLEDLGITYSSLVGHYYSNISDINIVVHGKRNYWELMKYLETAKHPKLKWKSEEQWLDFYKKRNRYKIFNKSEFLDLMSRKKSEGYFNGSLFVIFGVEKEDETWFKWGEEKYIDEGTVTVKGIITNNYNSIVRPGCYDIKNSVILKGKNNVDIKKIVFYSRDYGMLGFIGEEIIASGVLERVEPKNSDPYYRVVVGYFDSYINNKRDSEYIKVIKSKEECNFCIESKLNVGSVTKYGAKIIYSLGDEKNGWFATISPKTGGNPKEDFTIMLLPRFHLTHFSQINNNLELAKNFGIIFSKVSNAMTHVMAKGEMDCSSETKKDSISIATYGKSTNWKEKKEHVHIKVFPFRNNIGQPYTVDSSFQRKEIYNDPKSNKRYIKMTPVKKQKLSDTRFNELSCKLIRLLNSQRVDLHVHSTASDGEYSPSKLIDLAISQNLKAIAITDHDTLKGLNEAINYAKGKDIKFVPGIEIASDYPESNLFNIHILGLFVDPNNPALIKLSKKLLNARIVQKKKIIRKLNKQGYNITIEELKDYCGENLSRPGIAKILIKKYPNKFNSVKDVFDKLIGNEKSAFVKQWCPTFEETIKTIHNAGGVSILAHPGIYSNYEEIIKAFIKMNGKGLEIYYPYEKINQVSCEEEQRLNNKFKEIAEEKGLLITGGSDYHDNQRLTKLGEYGLIPEEFSNLLNKIKIINS